MANAELSTLLRVPWWRATLGQHLPQLRQSWIELLLSCFQDEGGMVLDLRCAPITAPDLRHRSALKEKESEMGSCGD
jgi:hypothetical protein